MYALAGDTGGAIVAGGEHELVGEVRGELLTLMCVTGNSRVDSDSLAAAACAAAATAAASMSRLSITHFRLQRKIKQERSDWSKRDASFRCGFRIN